MSTFLYREAMLSCSPVSMLYSPRKFTTLGLLEKPEENKKVCRSHCYTIVEVVLQV